MDPTWHQVSFDKNSEACSTAGVCQRTPQYIRSRRRGGVWFLPKHLNPRVSHGNYSDHSTSSMTLLRQKIHTVPFLIWIMCWLEVWSSLRQSLSALILKRWHCKDKWTTWRHCSSNAKVAQPLRMSLFTSSDSLVFIRNTTITYRNKTTWWDHQTMFPTHYPMTLNSHNRN